MFFIELDFELSLEGRKKSNKKNYKNLCSRIFDKGRRFEGKGDRIESRKDFEMLLRCRSAKKSRLCDPASNSQLPVNKMYSIAPSENTVSPSEEY